jgi:hypothetical protein
MGAQPILYSIVVSSVSNAYKKIGKEDKAYDYLVKSITPIDKRFNTFIGDLKEMGKEKAQGEEISKNTGEFVETAKEKVEDFTHEAGVKTGEVVENAKVEAGKIQKRALNTIEGAKKGFEKKV